MVILLRQVKELVRDLCSQLRLYHPVSSRVYSLKKNNCCAHVELFESFLEHIARMSCIQYYTTVTCLYYICYRKSCLWLLLEIMQLQSSELQVGFYSHCTVHETETMNLLLLFSHPAKTMVKRSESSSCKSLTYISVV